MNRYELSNKLDAIEVNRDQYSLDGDLRPDAVVLYQNYSKWEVFYFDERGNRNDQRSFNSEEEACEYIYKMFKSVDGCFALNTRAS